MRSGRRSGLPADFHGNYALTLSFGHEMPLSGFATGSSSAVRQPSPGAQRDSAAAHRLCAVVMLAPTSTSGNANSPSKTNLERITLAMSIDEIATPVAFRKVSQFFAAHISDVSSRAMGDPDLRRALDPTCVGLHITHNNRTVAAINSHAPAGFARGVNDALGDVNAAVRLMVRTKLLEHLAVAPGYRGRGYARALLEATEERHRADEEIEVWFGFVDDRERSSLGLYEHLGFVIAPNPPDLPGPAQIISRSYISRRGTWIYKQLREIREVTR